mgnify:CR=1 FL=1
MLVTVDLPVSGKRERDPRNGFVTPYRPGWRNSRDIWSKPGWLLDIARAGLPQMEEVSKAVKVFQAAGKKVIAQRLSSVTVLMDAPHDPHNGGAVLRSCDAFGADQITRNETNSDLFLTADRDLTPALSLAATVGGNAPDVPPVLVPRHVRDVPAIRRHGRRAERDSAIGRHRVRIDEHALLRLRRVLHEEDEGEAVDDALQQPARALLLLLGLLVAVLPHVGDAEDVDEFADDAESGEEEVLGVDESAAGAAEKSRDWRDVEKYKEERALRRLVDDDLDLADL